MAHDVGKDFLENAKKGRGLFLWQVWFKPALGHAAFDSGPLSELLDLPFDGRG